jgi:two-component system nitrogen regulation response regulator GlnG
MAPGEQIFPEDLPGNLSEAGASQQSQDGWPEGLRRWTQNALTRGQTDVMAEARSHLEKIILDCALDYTGGKRVEAAKLLGLGRNTLTRKLKEFEEAG